MMTKAFVLHYCVIDKATRIHIFKEVFISSFEPKAHLPLADINIILIKNGVGNRPVDAVATGPDLACRQTGLSRCRVLNPARQLPGKMR